MATTETDVIIVGAGLAGLVAASELAQKGKSVLLLDQEPEQSLGGQAFWSFGGLFFVNSPEQRRMGIRDSYALAHQDWMGTAAFDRPEDHWPRLWAEAYLDFAAGEKRAWLGRLGMRFFPVVGWAERGGYGAIGHGNSVPRFHVTWGTGPGVLAPFIQKVKEAEQKGLIRLRFRHRVNELLIVNGRVTGVAGDILEESTAERGIKTARVATGSFSFKASAVIVTSGGIGANHELVRRNWPISLGQAPEHMLCGVPDHVDGRMLAITEAAGGQIINPDRMWHYTEGIANWNPLWTGHGIRILPGPSSMWFDAYGRRLPVPLFPGFDTRGTLQHILTTGKEYTWFILNQKIIKKEFALSGSEQNPDLTGKSWKQVLKRAIGKSATPPVEAFKEKGEDFIVRSGLEELVAAMNELSGTSLLDAAHIRNEVEARDRELQNKFSKDLQVTAIRGARKYLGDRLIRTAPLHPILDPKAGPLIAVRLHLLTRKTLGGLHTDLSARVLNSDGQPIGGLYAAGEVAGFGGGGMHGYRALEGTFLGGCIFSGKIAGNAAAKEI
ncbi:FAD-binding dehydrogenase [Taibaiella koreensis]|uniref:FAD-binding dehydrogenase n=1 Tax=Taibaiella koreensis TaxID=1268548 RepID=UPI000E59A558|nr:FAD-binding dehydrogenase [Taibaiella koreensis]